MKKKYVILVTTQSNDVYETLKKGKIYYSNIEKIKFQNYKEQYKRLAKYFKFKETPIFCAPEEDTEAMDNSNCEGKLLTLKVPIEECHYCNYYNWSDYLYFSEHYNVKKWCNKIYDDIFNYTPLQALSHLRRYLGKYDPEDTTQVILNRIEPEWLIKA